MPGSGIGGGHVSGESAKVVVQEVVGAIGVLPFPTGVPDGGLPTGALPDPAARSALEKPKPYAGVQLRQSTMPMISAARIARCHLLTEEL